MCFRDGGHKTQAEPQTALGILLACAIDVRDAIKAVENMRQVIRRDTNAVICYSNSCFSGMFLQGDGDSAALRRVLHGIRKQIR